MIAGSVISLVVPNRTDDGQFVGNAGQLSQMFGRPFMGGMERKGIIAQGSQGDVKQAVEDVLADAPDRFILGADCTLPGDVNWDNIKTAIATAHAYTK